MKWTEQEYETYSQLKNELYQELYLVNADNMLISDTNYITKGRNYASSQKNDYKPGDIVYVDLDRSYFNEIGYQCEAVIASVVANKCVLVPFTCRFNAKKKHDNIQDSLQYSQIRGVCYERIIAKIGRTTPEELKAIKENIKNLF